METKWGQAIFGSRNCLTSLALLTQSLQSIMGATLTLLSNPFITFAILPSAEDIFLWILRNFTSWHRPD